tara:strand:- start:3167 stop:3457 length:291 start_codon:yes stop_codon:yes gene_type:complete
MDIDTMVFIKIHNTWLPAQIMAKRGSKYLVEVYRDREEGDNTKSNRKYQYWRHEKDVKLFTCETWREHGNYIKMYDALHDYKNAGGQLPPCRMRIM